MTSGFLILSGPSLIVESIWGVNKQMEDVLFALQLQKLNKNIITKFTKFTEE